MRLQTRPPLTFAVFQLQVDLCGETFTELVSAFHAWFYQKDGALQARNNLAGASHAGTVTKCLECFYELIVLLSQLSEYEK